MVATTQTTKPTVKTEKVKRPSATVVERSSTQR